MTALYVDTNVFLNVIYREQGLYKESMEFLQKVHKGKCSALTSSITLLELVLDIAESGYEELTDKAVASIEDIHNMEIVPLDKTMTKQAANFVLKDNVTIHDAYHLATALCRKAEIFVTRDEELRKKINKYVRTSTPDKI